MPVESEDAKKAVVASSEDVKSGDDSALNQSNVSEKSEGEHDPYYPPIITLPEVLIDSGEEDEDVLFKIRAKLYRYDSSSDPAEWKERGTGDVKLLKHTETGNIRLLMRRDKTYKVCANHSIQPWFVLRAHCGSEKAFVWSVQADFGDQGDAEPGPRPEMLAIRFANPENAAKFKSNFDDAVKQMTHLAAVKLKAEENNKEEGKDNTEDIVKMVEKVDLAEK